MRNRLLASGATLLVAATLGAGTAAAATTVSSTQTQTANTAQGPGGSNSAVVTQGNQTDIDQSGESTRAIVRQRNISIVIQRGTVNEAEVQQGAEASVDQTSTTGDNRSNVRQKNTSIVPQHACAPGTGQREIVRQRSAGGTRTFAVGGKEYVIVNQVNISIVYQSNC